MDSRRAGRKVLFVCLAFSLCPAVHPATGPSAEGSDATAAIGDATPAELVQELAGRGADGRFIEDLPGRYTFSPLRSEWPDVYVTNPEAVGALGVGPMVTVRGSLENRRLKVTAYDLVTPAPQIVAQTGPAQDAGRAAGQLMARLSTLARQSARSMSVTDRSLAPASPWTGPIKADVRQLVEAYRQAVEQRAAPEVDAIVRQWSEVRGQLASMFPYSEDYKAIYGSLDNYAPWRYDLIYKQSASVVAIGEPGQDRSLCSGVLIAPDLVLTAAHCFYRSGRLPQQLEVWFDYVESPPGTPVPAKQRRRIDKLMAPSPNRLGEIMAGGFRATLLDYAIVRMDSGSPADRPAACVRKEPLQKGDAVYVIGYPRGYPATVHDGARVYLPFRVFDGEHFARLRLDVDADLLGTPKRAEFMAEFDRSYVQEDEDGLKWRVLRHVGDGGQPRMGIVADTFRGNSGGPVYDREREQCVVGILNAGAADTGERRSPHWGQHERVLPMSAILADLQTSADTRAVAGRLRIEP